MKAQSSATDLPPFLDALRAGRELESGTRTVSGIPLRIAIVTNFTDDLLGKTLAGLSAHAEIATHIYSVPFRQYHFELKNDTAPLWHHTPDITCVFFAIDDFHASEFTSDPSHVEDTLADLDRLCHKNTGIVLLQTCLTPSTVQHERLMKDSPASVAVKRFNQGIRALQNSYSNVRVIETDVLALDAHIPALYDMRNLYASSQPFQNDFLYRISCEWFGAIRTIAGRTRKCIVVDLDNTLWGGVVGELGPLGIALGNEYPGNAYVAFQKVLLHYYERGIILAINSRNNPADVAEVFEKNPHMVLSESHFASIVVNWETKADNLRRIALELNIGLDSLVFIDDDPMNRDLVRTQLPEVSVPDFSLAPEEYARTLLNLTQFYSFTLTEEDKRRGEMYVAERKRKELQESVPTLEEYLATLNMEIGVTVNDRSLLPRLAQMTQKTNQFNLTTRRRTESEIEAQIAEGGFVFAGDVTDKFGSHGITIMSVFTPKSDTELTLDTCLMSCRVMGREVEHAFFESIAEHLLEKGYTGVHASFIPTAKNAPALPYLASLGGTLLEEREGAQLYYIDLASVVDRKKSLARTITVNLIP